MISKSTLFTSYREWACRSWLVLMTFCWEFFRSVRNSLNRGFLTVWNIMARKRGSCLRVEILTGSRRHFQISFQTLSHMIPLLSTGFWVSMNKFRIWKRRKIWLLKINFILFWLMWNRLIIKGTLTRGIWPLRRLMSGIPRETILTIWLHML